MAAVNLVIRASETPFPQPGRIKAAKDDGKRLELSQPPVFEE